MLRKLQGIGGIPQHIQSTSYLGLEGRTKLSLVNFIR